ncbi:MAG: OsmC family protein [Candidatus Thermoplasmatota archaeon]|nr:OsmC family protein [Candidatus Thermoplasmatota archaeon]
MAYVKPIEGLALMGSTDSGHQVPIDTKKAVGGKESAASPMELVIQALLGCTAMDVISILRKMKVDYDLFEVHETHEKAQEHPKVYTKIHLIFRFEGVDMDHEKIRKAVYLSKDRYCSVSAMLKQTVDISYEITVNGQRID